MFPTDDPTIVEGTTETISVSPQLVVLVAAGVVLGVAGVASALTRLHTAVMTTVVDLLVGVVKVLLVALVVLVLYLFAEHGETAEAPPPNEVTLRR